MYCTCIYECRSAQLYSCDSAWHKEGKKNKEIWVETVKREEKVQITSNEKKKGNVYTPKKKQFKPQTKKNLACSCCFFFAISTAYWLGCPNFWCMFIVHQRQLSKLREKKTLRALSRQTCMVLILCCCWFLFIYCVYRRRSIRLSCASTVQTPSRVFLLIEELTALLKAASFTKSFFFLFPSSEISLPLFLISIREAEETLLFCCCCYYYGCPRERKRRSSLPALETLFRLFVCLFFVIVVVFPTRDSKKKRRSSHCKQREKTR